MVETLNAYRKGSPHQRIYDYTNSAGPTYHIKTEFNRIRAVFATNVTLGTRNPTFDENAWSSGWIRITAGPSADDKLWFLVINQSG